MSIRDLELNHETQPAKIDMLHPDFIQHPQFSYLISLIACKDYPYIIIHHEMHNDIVQFLGRLIESKMLPILQIKYEKCIHFNETKNDLTAFHKVIEQFQVTQKSICCFYYAGGECSLSAAIKENIFMLIFTRDISFNLPNARHIYLQSVSDYAAKNLLHKKANELSIQKNILIRKNTIDYLLSLTARYFNKHCFYEEAKIALNGVFTLQALHTPNKPDVDETIINSYFSSRLEIPADYINTTFKEVNFLQYMNNHFIGQTQAIERLSSGMRKQFSKIQAIPKPAVFLFIGEPHSGKKYCAQMVSKYIFGSDNTNYFIWYQQKKPLLDHLAFNPYSHHSLTLKQILAEKPFSMITFVSIEKFSPEQIPQLNALIRGETLIERHSRYNASLTTIILTSTLTSEMFAKNMKDQEQINDEDLLEWVKTVKVLETPSDEVTIDKIAIQIRFFETLKLKLPIDCHVIPFTPLQKHHYHNIFKLMMKKYCEDMENTRNIGISYADELITWLCSCLPGKFDLHSPIKQVMQRVYECVDLMVAYMDSMHPIDLYIELNEDGTALKCIPAE